MALEQQIFANQGDDLPAELASMSVDAIRNRSKLLDNEIRVLKEESNRLSLELSGLKEKVKENKDKIKLNNQLPYLVANIVEVLEVLPPAVSSLTSLPISPPLTATPASGCKYSIQHSTQLL